MKPLRPILRRKDGVPASYVGVLNRAVNRIRAGSCTGVGLYLSAEEVRALDWAVIRAEGGIETDLWRQKPCDGGSPND